MDLVEVVGIVKGHPLARSLGLEYKRMGDRSAGVKSGRPSSPVCSGDRFTPISQPRKAAVEGWKDHRLHEPNFIIEAVRSDVILPGPRVSVPPHARGLGERTPISDELAGPLGRRGG